MTKSEQLANRLREVILNGIRIANTNFRNQLENLDWKIATKKNQSQNTISNLAQHVHYYIQNRNTDSSTVIVTYDFYSMAMDNLFTNQISNQAYTWWDISRLFNRYQKEVKTV